MAIVYDGRQLAGVAARGRRRKRHGGPCCDGGAAPCEHCADVAGEILAGLGELTGARGHRRRALGLLAHAHRRGQLAGLADIDMSSFVVSQSSIDAEAAAFDGRLNAWLFDYATAAARLPPSFVQQVDDFVARWRDQKDSFYFFQTSRLSDLMATQAQFNRLRDQFLGYGQTTAIAPATVTADGKTVRADQIPPGSDWTSGITTAIKWGGAIAGGLLVLKIAHDAGVVGRISQALRSKAAAA
jgi:hypothetical protein